jgi:hypothetical protein
MTATIQAKFEAAARKDFPEIDLGKTGTDSYRVTMVRAMYQAYLWGFKDSLEERAEFNRKLAEAHG